MRVVKHWNRLPRKVIKSWFLEICRSQQDMALSKLFQLTLIWAENLNLISTCPFSFQFFSVFFYIVHHEAYTAYQGLPLISSFPLHPPSHSHHSAHHGCTLQYSTVQHYSHKKMHDSGSSPSNTEAEHKVVSSFNVYFNRIMGEGVYK